MPVVGADIVSSVLRLLVEPGQVVGIGRRVGWPVLVRLIVGPWTVPPVVVVHPGLVVVAVLGGLPARRWEVVGPRVGRVALVGGDLLPRFAVRIGVVGVPGEEIGQSGRVRDDPDRFRHPHRQAGLRHPPRPGIRRLVGRAPSSSSRRRPRRGRSVSAVRLLRGWLGLPASRRRAVPVPGRWIRRPGAWWRPGLSGTSARAAAPPTGRCGRPPRRPQLTLRWAVRVAICRAFQWCTSPATTRSHNRGSRWRIVKASAIQDRTDGVEASNGPTRPWAANSATGGQPTGPIGSSRSTSSPPSGWSTLEWASAQAAATSSLRQPAIRESFSTSAARSVSVRGLPSAASNSASNMPPFYSNRRSKSRGSNSRIPCCA